VKVTNYQAYFINYNSKKSFIVQAYGANIIKPFTVVIYECLSSVRVLVPGKPF